MQPHESARCRYFSRAGALTLDDSGFVLLRDLMPRDVEHLPPGAVGRMHCGGDETHITIKPQPIGGVRFHLNLRFKNDRLRLIEMKAANESVPEVMAASDGGTWSRENELARKRFHEAWAGRALGLELTIKPWVDPDLPEPVMPASPGPEHARYVSFVWGEIGSYFDEKGCAALLIVCCGQPLPHGATSHRRQLSSTA